MDGFTATGPVTRPHPAAPPPQEEGHSGSWISNLTVQRIHGYEPGTVTPTTELVHTRKTFRTRHRIIDTAGNVHSVVVVIGDQLYGDDGVVVGIRGFYVDLTPASGQVREDIISERVAEIAERRGAIDQPAGSSLHSAHGGTNSPTAAVRSGYRGTTP